MIPALPSPAAHVLSYVFSQKPLSDRSLPTITGSSVYPSKTASIYLTSKVPTPIFLYPVTSNPMSFWKCERKSERCQVSHSI